MIANGRSAPLTHAERMAAVCWRENRRQRRNLIGLFIAALVAVVVAGWIWILTHGGAS